MNAANINACTLYICEILSYYALDIAVEGLFSDFSARILGGSVAVWCICEHKQ
jgi:hypothetical protein